MQNFAIKLHLKNLKFIQFLLFYSIHPFPPYLQYDNDTPIVFCQLHIYKVEIIFYSTLLYSILFYANSIYLYCS